MDKADSKFISRLGGVTEKPFFPLVLFILGMITALLETIYLLILGNSLENAVWPLAIRNLEYTFVLRKSVPSVAILCGLILSVGLWLMIRKQQQKSIPNWIAYLLIFISGVNHWAICRVRNYGFAILEGSILTITNFVWFHSFFVCNRL